MRTWLSQPSRALTASQSKVSEVQEREHTKLSKRNPHTARACQTNEVTVNTGLFINNDFVPAADGSSFETSNPANGKQLATVSLAQPADIDAAVTAAKRAFDSTWKNSPPQQRAQLLHKLADLIERDADALATLEALDAGILFAQSKHLHIPQAVDALRYFAGWADKLNGTSLSIPNGIAYTRREALGVCGAIVPWNAPL